MVLLREIVAHGPHHWHCVYYIWDRIYLDFFGNGRNIGATAFDIDKLCSGLDGPQR